MPSLKVIGNYVILVIAILFLGALFVFKGNLNTLVSKKMKEQAGEKVKKDMAMYVDSAYNFRNNKEGYRITFLEFGATGCSSCRLMEKVMEKVRSKYTPEVKVHFLNVLKPANRAMMEYFGVAAIPTQVLLDISGKEVFRHTGFYSFDDLANEFQKIHP
jgi:thioredoxin 1